MESSGKHGAVIFTLGTYAGTVMSLSAMKKMARAFAAIPQRVIWQMKNDPPESLQVPENTRIVSWMPQNDLLGNNDNDHYGDCPPKITFGQLV